MPSKLSTQVRRLIPSYIADENPRFSKFIRYYLEFIESYHADKMDGIKDPYDLISLLTTETHDIDKTAEMFLEHYRAAYLSKFSYEDDLGRSNPDGATSTNFRTLIKNIRDLYLSKGSIPSIQFFFRSIYGTSVNVYLPKQDILRASDGFWFEPYMIRPDRAILFGNENDAYGNLQEEAFPIDQRISQVLGLSSWDNSETYDEDERVWHIDRIWTSDINNNTSEPGVTNWSPYTITAADMENLFSLQNQLVGPNGSAFVRDIRQPKFEEWNEDITYEIDAVVSWNDINWIANAQTIEEPGTGSEWDQYDSPLYIELSNVTGNFRVGDRIEMRDPLVVGEDGGAVLAHFQIGPLAAEEWQQFVTLPDGTQVPREYFPGARVEHEGLLWDYLPGSIEDEPTTEEPGTGPAWTLDAESLEDFSALIRIEPGTWLNEDSWLSDIKVLQDNDYYQDFSYEVTTPVDQNLYQKSFLDNIHPAGLKFFSVKSAGPAAEADLGLDIKIKAIQWFIYWYNQIPDILDEDTFTFDIMPINKIKTRRLTYLPRFMNDWSGVERMVADNPHYNIWQVDTQSDTTGPNQFGEFVSDFEFNGGYNHTLLFKKTANGYVKVPSQDNRFAVTNNKLHFTEVTGELENKVQERQDEFEDLILYHLNKRKHNGISRILTSGENLTLGGGNALIEIEITNEQVYGFDDIDLDNIMIFVNGRLLTDNSLIAQLTKDSNKIDLVLNGTTSKFNQEFGAGFHTVDVIFLEENNKVLTKITRTVPAQTDLVINSVSGELQGQVLVFRNNFLVDEYTLNPYENLTLINDSNDPRTYQIWILNQPNNLVVRKKENIKPVFGSKQISTDGPLTNSIRVVQNNELQQHTQAPTYTRMAPTQITYEVVTP